ncbi:PREDICTED: uncharacterized protein LOC108768208 [Trachymyrmex cornetzi]|uniref:uncharacterized protein LOC108768208 n=1 Tax=Trachymyrmex cornetzi TaxID=471704 RepID=UPI00084F3A7B|nr:PREDICTED: uncharacterized protein LOC108768208 [Trachymyrmex cornetzi]
MVWTSSTPSTQKSPALVGKMPILIGWWALPCAIDQNTVDVEEVKLRLNKLGELHAALEEILIKLSSHDESLTDEVVQQHIAEYEERCVYLRLKDDRLIKSRVRQAVSNDDLETNNEEVQTTRRPINGNTIRLPKIDLPTFSGAYEDWHPFHDTFCSLIHSNDSLNVVQKFHYSKSALKGEAAKVIASLEISAVNYTDAWNRLKERFENERVAIQNPIKAIFELLALKQENGVALITI